MNGNLEQIALENVLIKYSLQTLGDVMIRTRFWGGVLTSYFSNYHIVFEYIYEV